MSELELIKEEEARVNVINRRISSLRQNAEKAILLTGKSRAVLSQNLVSKPSDAAIFKLYNDMQVIEAAINNNLGIIDAELKELFGKKIEMYRKALDILQELKWQRESLKAQNPWVFNK